MATARTRRLIARLDLVALRRKPLGEQRRTMTESEEAVAARALQWALETYQRNPCGEWELKIMPDAIKTLRGK